mmetsp:Transcript_120726/g.240431  ORF Transcript_120726/g.240431 Transcript_120726/m.240431 type:complete len:594 (+) Transcript_120726:92-1873(+)
MAHNIMELFHEEETLLEQQLFKEHGEHQQCNKCQADALRVACEQQREIQEQLKAVQATVSEQQNELDQLVYEVQALFADTELQQQQPLLQRQVHGNDSTTNEGDRVQGDTGTGSRSTRRMPRGNTLPQDDPDRHEEEAKNMDTVVMTTSIPGLQLFNPNSSRLGRFVMGNEFNAISTTVILLNACFIGFSVQYAVDHVDDPPNKIILYIEWAFYAFYFVELVLKLIVFGRYFFIDIDWKWNIFDLFLVIMAIYDVTIYTITEQGVIDSGSVNVAWMRLLRLMKMLKMLRVVRVMRFFRELRLMFYSITSSFRSLVWAMVMLMLIMYIFALSFIQGATMYILDNQPKDISFEVEESLFLHWTTVVDALITLFMAISGGTDWVNPMLSCEAMGTLYHLLFLFYICFATIAVLNVLTGIFVDAALDAAQSDRDSVSATLEAVQREQNRAGAIFFTENEDGTINTSITKEEFEEHLQANVTKIYFHQLGIDTSEAQWLFKQLDNSGDGEVSIDELKEGLIRLKGMARSIDMVSLAHECRTYGRQMSVFMPFVEDCFSVIGSALEKHRGSNPVGLPALGAITALRHHHNAALDSDGVQ